MSDPTPPDDNTDDVLRRADALLHKHRRSPTTTTATAAVSPATGADIPTLTDIVIEGEVLPRTEPAQQAQTGTPTTGGGQVISRVQAQNIEHAVYLKLKRGLNDQIAGVVRDRYLPEIGAALEQALSRASTELQAGIADMVRTFRRGNTAEPAQTAAVTSATA